MADAGGFVDENQVGTILGELRSSRSDPDGYEAHRQPDCMALDIVECGQPTRATGSTQYFLFKLEERTVTSAGWIRIEIGKLMRRRQELSKPQQQPDDEVTVLTVAQTGELRARQAGKGRPPPEWRGMYFEDMPTK